MKYFKLILLIVSISLVISCKKEDPEQELPNNYTVVIEVNGDTFEVENDQIIEMEGPDKLGMHVTNNISSKIKLKLEVISLTGSGTGVELCFSQCRSSISAGDIDVLAIDTGITTTTNQTHLAPNNEYDQTLIVEFKIIEVDKDGEGVVNGKEVNFTYSYVKPK